MTEPPSTEPPSPRPGFLATLVRVLAADPLALGLLALLQYRYGR